MHQLWWLWLWLRLTWALVVNGPLNLPKYRRGVMKICFAWSLDRRSIELDCLVRSDHRGGELRRRRWWWPYSNNYLGRCCNNCFSAQLWLARRSQTIRQTANYANKFNAKSNKTIYSGHLIMSWTLNILCLYCTSAWLHTAHFMMPRNSMPLHVHNHNPMCFGLIHLVFLRVCV